MNRLEHSKEEQLIDWMMFLMHLCSIILLNDKGEEDMDLVGLINDYMDYKFSINRPRIDKFIAAVRSSPEKYGFSREEIPVDDKEPKSPEHIDTVQIKEQIRQNKNYMDKAQNRRRKLLVLIPVLLIAEILSLTILKREFVFISFLSALGIILSIIPGAISLPKSIEARLVLYALAVIGVPCTIMAIKTIMDVFRERSIAAETNRLTTQLYEYEKDMKIYSSFKQKLDAAFEKQLKEYDDRKPKYRSEFSSLSQFNLEELKGIKNALTYDGARDLYDAIKIMREKQRYTETQKQLEDMKKRFEEYEEKMGAAMIALLNSGIKQCDACRNQNSCHYKDYNIGSCSQFRSW